MSKQLFGYIRAFWVGNKPGKWRKVRIDPPCIWRLVDAVPEGMIWGSWKPSCREEKISADYIDPDDWAYCPYCGHVIDIMNRSPEEDK